MLTLQQLRGDKELAIKKLAKKGVDAAPIIAKIEELDDARKALQMELYRVAKSALRHIPPQPSSCERALSASVSAQELSTVAGSW